MAVCHFAGAGIYIRRHATPSQIPMDPKLSYKPARCLLYCISTKESQHAMTSKSPREVLRLFGACARGAADASAGVPLNFKIGELTEEDPGPTWVDLGEYWSLKVMGQLMSPSSRMPTTACRIL